MVDRSLSLHCDSAPRESTANESTKALLLERQKEYKAAALTAKKRGDVEQARLYFKTSKVSRRTTAPSLCLHKHVLYKFESLFLGHSNVFKTLLVKPLSWFSVLCAGIS